MKVNVKKAIEIDNLGLFVQEEQWNGFTKWKHTMSNDFIVTFKNSCNSIDMVLKSMFQMDIENEEVTIVVASATILEHIMQLKKEKD